MPEVKCDESLEFIALDKSKQDEHSKKIKKLRKKKKIDEFSSGNPGVVFLSHIPHGFFEPQMKSYFEQFGDVTRLRLSRSKKTGRSKGYAFIEFLHKEVAEVVAETMNNYLMMERILKCHVVPPEQLHPKTFKGCNRKFRKPNSRKLAIMRYNQRSNDAELVEKRVAFKNRKKSDLEQKLAKIGVKYDMSNLKANPNWMPEPRKIMHSIKQETNNEENKNNAQESEQEVPQNAFTDIKQLSTNTEVDISEKSMNADRSQSVSSYETDQSLSSCPTMLVDSEDEEVTFKIPVRAKVRSVKKKQPSPPRSVECSPRIKKMQSRKRKLNAKRQLLELQ